MSGSYVVDVNEDHFCRTATNGFGPGELGAAGAGRRRVCFHRNCQSIQSAGFQRRQSFFRQRTLVEEAAQEVFLKAFTQLDSYEGRWLDGRMVNSNCH